MPSSPQATNSPSQTRPAAVAPAPHPYEVWKQPGFTFYMVSWFLLIFASQIETVAAGIEIYHRTKSPLSLGWIGLFRAAPVMLLSIVGGHLADSFDRKKVLLASMGLGFFATVGLTWATHAQAPTLVLYFLLALSATGQALGGPARAAILPQLVPTALLAAAVTWNFSAFQVSTMVGPAVGGLLIGQSNITWYAFALAMILRGLSWISMITLPSNQPQGGGERITLASVLAGMRFVCKQRIILATITLDLFAVLFGGMVYLLPLFAEDVFHVGARGLGFLRSAEAVGAILTAMTVAHLPPLRRPGKAMLWAVAGFGVATIVFGLSSWFWLALAMVFFVGACDSISVVVRHSLVQILTPDAMRGRVSAVNSVFIVASNDLGGLESGVSAQIFAWITALIWINPTLPDAAHHANLLGAAVSVVFGGTCTLLSVLLALRYFPEVARLGPLSELAPDEKSAAAILAPPLSSPGDFPAAPADPSLPPVAAPVDESLQMDD